MFVSQSVREWGGVTIDLADGENTSSITISKDPPVLKITAPSRKGAFDLQSITFVKYRSLAPGRGVLIVGFTPSVSGVNKNREYQVGEVTEAHWLMFKDNVSRLVHVVEE
jgi:hypothetical protein